MYIPSSSDYLEVKKKKHIHFKIPLDTNSAK